MDIDRIGNSGGDFRIVQNSQILSYKARLDDAATATTKNINAQFMVIHKSKGLEVDIVINLNCNSGKKGFTYICPMIASSTSS